MEKHITKINLGTKYNSNLKTEIIPLNILTFQLILPFINEDSNYIFPDNFIDLWDVFKVELQKYRISAHNKVSYIITSAQVKKVQNIVSPFKDMIQNIMIRHNSNSPFSQQITNPIEMSEFLFKYNIKTKLNLLPYTYQDFLREKAHQAELDRMSEMEKWRIEDEARKVREIEDEARKVREIEELKKTELIKQIAIEKEKEKEIYDNLCIQFYKNNIKNRDNMYCLFHIHPHKQCNMKDTGKKCGYKHEFPTIELLKSSKKCMKRSKSK